jgi:hypothetical protein
LRKHWPALSQSAVVVVLLAVITLAAAGWRMDYALQPLRWPTTTGQVTRSEQSQVFVGERIGRYTNSQIWEPRFHVAYVYRVSGHAFTGTRIDEFTRDGRKYVITGTRRFPVGSTVSVRYDPNNHESAVLEADVPWGAVTAALLSLTALVLALAPSSREPSESANEDELEVEGERTLLGDPAHTRIAERSRGGAERTR